MEDGFEKNKKFFQKTERKNERTREKTQNGGENIGKKPERKPYKAAESAEINGAAEKGDDGGKYPLSAAACRHPRQKQGKTADDAEKHVCHECDGR